MVTTNATKLELCTGEGNMQAGPEQGLCIGQCGRPGGRVGAADSKANC